jgi:hypothetical protein
LKAFWRVLREVYFVRNSGWLLLLSICLLASAIAAGQTDAHDLKITTRHTSGSNEFTTTAYFSGENSRSEMQIFSGKVNGHHRASIRKNGAENIQVYDLDLDAHKYVSYQTDLRGIVPGAKTIAVKPSGKTYVINTDIVDTGERKEMFGHTARHLITRETRIGGPENCYGGNTESVIDGWYIDYDALPLQQRPKAGAVVALLSLSSRGGERCYDKIEVHRTGPPTGYALKQTTTWPNDVPQPGDTSGQNRHFSGTEVVEFVEGPLDPRLFQVPSDFKKVDEIMDPTQRQLQAMTYWERFKAEFRSIFH